MALINIEYNESDKWIDLQLALQQRTEVDLAEVQRVIELSRRTPGLSEYEDGLRKLAVYFAVANDFYRDLYPNELADLVAFWDRYRAAVIQRFAGVTPVELHAADKVVADVFGRFLTNIPNEHVAYDAEAVPLVYGGEGGIGAYFTHPPGWNRPFAIINLPHAAFDNVWQWLALAHETGHDIYASVPDLREELGTALETTMHQAVDDGDIAIDSVSLDLSPYGVPHVIQYSGKQLLGTLWRNWADESQADVVGLLSCGGAALVALQQIIEFGAQDHWLVSENADGTFSDRPEEHPTPYVRNALNLAALRRIDGGSHAGLVDEIHSRFTALAPEATDIVWRADGVLEVARVPVREMLKSAELAADVLLNHSLTCFGGKSYSDLADFTSGDQQIVADMVEPLLKGDATFAEPGQPRHALAATMFAFERNRSKADVINRTFQHFV